MPFNVERYPANLTALLSLRERGQGPQQLSEMLVGTLELTELYALPDSQIIGGSSVAGVGAGIVLAVEVPQGESWLVYGASLFLNILAGGTGKARLSIRPPNTVNANNLGITAYVGTVAAAAALLQEGVAFVPPNRYWVRGGSTINVDVSTAITAGSAYAWGLSYTPVRQSV